MHEWPWVTQQCDGQPNAKIIWPPHVSDYDWLYRRCCGLWRVEVSKSRDLSISPCCLYNDKWETLTNTFLLTIMPRLTTNERHRAMGMLEGGVGIRQVARMMGCSPQTIINLRRRYQETNSVDDRPRPGAQRVTTPDQDRYIVLQHLRDRFRTAVQTAAETPGTHQERIRPITVRRRLHANDLRAHRPSIGNVLKPLRRQNRHPRGRDVS